MHRALLAISLYLLAVPARAAPEVRDPVAVLPFKNVNRSAEIDWMSAGIAETLVSDIRKRSTLRVVERDQLDRALGELAFQASKSTDAGTAAAVGRIVGARTVVVGGYQKAGQQLRITARFVEVESGVVLDAAKATGPVANIFALQDTIVDKLLGAAPTARKTAASRPKREPASARTLKAYQMYSTSLTSVTATGRASMLKKALEIDPAFSYALDDLKALEERMAQYERLAEQALDERARQLAATARDERADIHKRQTAYLELYGILVAHARHRAAGALGEEIYAMTWPADLAPMMRPNGLFWIFQSKMALKQPDQALQIGEQFLREFPATPFYASVSTLMQTLIDQQRRREQGRDKVDEALARNRLELARLDFDRCDLTFDHFDFGRALDDCRDFVTLHADTEDPAIRELVGRARWILVEVHLERGAFSGARVLAETILREHPEIAKRRAVLSRMRDWPRE